MIKVLIALLIVATVGCSTNVNHHKSPVKHDINGDSYSVVTTAETVEVTARYSEYQFIRSSEDGFKGCADLMNFAASEYALTGNKTVNFIDWTVVKKEGLIDHGRDLITAVMNVNCRYTYILQDIKT